MTSRRLAILFAGAVLGSVSQEARADRILYYVDGEAVVFTNTPSRRDVKPAFPRDVSRFGGGAGLPATPYDAFIDEVARENGLEPALIKAVALVESGFNPRAVSNKGARGIMQFIPSTAARYGVSDLHDPHQSLRAGARHLRDLLDEFGGDLTLALAAYNAGAGAVRRHGGVPAYPETREYVRKVKAKLGAAEPRTAGRAAAASRAKVSLRLAPDGSITLYN